MGMIFQKSGTMTKKKSSLSVPCQMALMDGTYNLPYLDISDGIGQHNWGQVIPQRTQSRAKRVFIGSARIFETRSILATNAAHRAEI